MNASSLAPSQNEAPRLSGRLGEDTSPSENASDPESARRLEAEQAKTTENEAISSDLKEDIKSLQTKLRMLTRAVVTTHDWLLQDANCETDMIIMAWQQTVEECHNALISLEQIEDAEVRRIGRSFYEASDDATRKLQAVQAEVLGLQEQLRADLAVINEVFETQTAAAIEARSHHTP